LGLVRAHARQLKRAQGAAQRAALDAAERGIELAGETAAFAVISLGQVDELKVEAEGPSELVGGGVGEGLDVLEGAGEVVLR
jgi:hypothetical protein